MKSVRLEASLQRRLEQASQAQGRSQSEVIREAIDRYCGEVIVGRLDLRLAPFIGVVHGGGGRAHATHDKFLKALRDDKATKAVGKR